MSGQSCSRPSTGRGHRASSAVKVAQVLFIARNCARQLVLIFQMRPGRFYNNCLLNRGYIGPLLAHASKPCLLAARFADTINMGR